MPKLIRFDPAAAFSSGTGLDLGEFRALEATLDKCRDEICDLDVKMLTRQIATPESKQPLLAGFYLLPERQLADYVADRSGSELARILAVTKQMMANVDRVVVLGSAAVNLGGQALLHACCQPYFNELSRADRGSRPRITFAGDDFDNDAIQGLLYLLNAHRAKAADGVEASWALSVCSKQFDEPQLLAALPALQSALLTNCGGYRELLLKRLIVIAGQSVNLAPHVPATLAGRFPLASDVGDCFSILSPAGLTPAALMGINIMKLQEGAAAINEHFRSIKSADNIVLQLAATNYVAHRRAATLRRVIQVWSQSLMTTARWYGNLTTQCLVKNTSSSSPLAILGARDTLVRHSLIRSSGVSIVNHVQVEGCRFDALPASGESAGQAGINNESNCGTQPYFPELMQEEIAACHREQAKAGLPSTVVHLPQVDEFNMGQYFQLCMLATVVEARLRGENPYN